MLKKTLSCFILLTFCFSLVWGTFADESTIQDNLVDSEDFTNIDLPRVPFEEYTAEQSEADKKELQELKEKSDTLNKQLSENYSEDLKKQYLDVYAEYLEKSDEIEHAKAKAEWRVFQYTDNSDINPFSRWPINQNNFIDYLKAWDIITIQYLPGNSDEWKFWEEYRAFLKYWSHSVLYIWNWEIISIEWKKQKVNIYNAKSYFRSKRYTINQIAISKINLSDRERINLVRYVKNFRWAPYVPLSLLPWLKYSTKAFYCSSLIWRAHYSSWARRDLDPNSWSKVDIIFPFELINTADEKIFVKF